MNNSKLAVDSATFQEKVAEIQPLLQEREAKLIRIIEAIGKIQDSEAWSTLKTELFDDLPKRLNKELRQEARQENPNTNKLNRITGELKWAEKFADLSRLEASQRVELQGVRQQLHGRNE